MFDRPAQLADEPLPGARRCELAAGDAVVFDAAMVHSGSADADRRRRTFNVAYREFGGPVLAHSRATCWKPDLFESLTPETAPRFEGFERSLRDERDVIEAAFRAVIERDGAEFREHLARLHPGRVGRMVCVVQLHKIAHALWKLAEIRRGGAVRRRLPGRDAGPRRQPVAHRRAPGALHRRGGEPSAGRLRRPRPQAAPRRPRPAGRRFDRAHRIRAVRDAAGLRGRRLRGELAARLRTFGAAAGYGRRRATARSARDRRHMPHTSTCSSPAARCSWNIFSFQLRFSR